MHRHSRRLLRRWLFTVSAGSAALMVAWAGTTAASNYLLRRGLLGLRAGTSSAVASGPAQSIIGNWPQIIRCHDTRSGTTENRVFYLDYFSTDGVYYFMADNYITFDRSSGNVTSVGNGTYSAGCQTGTSMNTIISNGRAVDVTNTVISAPMTFPN